MKYRMYSFVNHLYMNPKQWGIQTAHCVSSMSVKYKNNTEESAAYQTWASEEPTIIMCEGGNVAMLNSLWERLWVLAAELNLPAVKFHEDQDSLGGVITAVAVLVPETYFGLECNLGLQGVNFTRFVDGKIYQDVTLSETEQDLVKIIKGARLA